MTRPVTLLRVDLDVFSPWSVGAVADTGTDVHLPVLTDPRGETPTPYLPATSLVGSLRRHLGPLADRWLGPEDAETAGVRASPLRCLGTRIGGSTEISQRKTTAIDPARRAAEGNTLRTGQQVESSKLEPTRVHWWLQHDLEPGPVAELLAALVSWQPFVGRGRNVGQGAAAVMAVHYAAVDLDRADDLGWWLGPRHQWDGVDPGSAPPGWQRFRPDQDIQPGSPEELTAQFVLAEPLFIGSDLVTKSASGRGQTRVSLDRIPATSWKGIFRHRVEHVLRVCGLDPQTHGAPVVARLFGSPRASAASVGGGERGVLRFQPSRIDEDAPTVTRTHVAIDRVTGGARDRAGERRGDNQGGALYTVQAYAPETVVDLTIELLAPMSVAETNLLWHVIRDLDDGVLGVGGMTGRGYGTLAPHGPRTEPTSVIIQDLVSGDAGE